MHRNYVCSVAAVCGLAAWLSGPGRPAAPLQTRAGLPLVFEPAAPEAKGADFVARGRGYALAVQGGEAALTLRNGNGERARLRLRLEGARKPAAARAEEPSGGASHYLLGDDPARWRTNVRHYQRVRYQGVYPGIDVVYYGNQADLEYDFVLAPGADPDQIRLRWEGARRMAMDAAGDLLLELDGGAVRQKRPRVFQGRREIAARYEIAGPDQARILLARYDRSRPLVIDPALTYATYFGKAGNESGNAIAVDGSGAAYVAGVTESPQLATAGAIGATYTGAGDAFVMKLSPDGATVNWVTYLGGTGEDAGLAIAVDGAGAAYVTGYTGSTDFPVVGAIRGANAGATDAFVAKLNNAGSTLLYSTYMGGSGADSGRAIAIDGQGAAYVAGVTTSANFPTQTPLQAALGGGADAFALKLNPLGTQVVYSTYIGGALDDAANGIAVGSDGVVALAGATASNNFPLRSPFQNLLKGSGDAWVAKLLAAGNEFLYSTYLGGSIVDEAASVAMDANGVVYAAGSTSSPDFPTIQPLLNQLTGASDAFVTRFNPTGGVLASTFYGGISTDVAYAVRVSGSGVYLAGGTSSPNFPAVSPVVGVLAGLEDAFIVRLGLQLDRIEYSTYFGGTGNDRALALAVDGNGGAYVAGYTESSNVPTQNPAQGANGGSTSPRDVLLVKLGDTGQDALVPVIVRTSPEGAVFTVDGVNYNAQQTFFYRVGSNHTVGAPSPQPVQIRQGNLVLTIGGARVLFTFWSDGGADTHTITVGPQGGIYTAVFSRQNQLTTRVNPEGAGTITANPPPMAGGWYNSSTTVELNVTANSGFAFAGWSDEAAGTTNPLFVPMTEPRSLQAQFSYSQSGCVFGLSALSLRLEAGGGSDFFDLTAPPGCLWTAVPTRTWLTTQPTSGSGSARINYTVASNTEVQPRTATIQLGGETLQIIQSSGLQGQVFNDVPRNHPYFDHIALLRNNAITSGCSATDYCPDATTTRSQMAVFLVRSIERGDNFPFQAQPYFTDVPATHPHFKYVQRLRERNITTGCSANEYCPDAPVTRGQMAVFLVRGRLGITSLVGTPFPQTPYFRDVPGTHQYYGYIQKLRQLAITSGCTANDYCSESSTTRGQMAVFLIRAFFTP